MGTWLRRSSAILLCGLLMQGCGKDSPAPQPPAPLPYAWIAIDTSASMAGFFRPTQKGATPGYPTIQRLMASDELINLLNHPEPLTPFVSEVGLTVSDGSQVHSLANWATGPYEHLVKEVYRQTDSRFPDLFAPKRVKDLERYRIVLLITDLVVDFSGQVQGDTKPTTTAEDKKAGKESEVEQACNMGNDVGCLAGRLIGYLRAHPAAGLWIIGIRDSFKGDYYPVGGGKFSYRGLRPIYILVLSSNIELGWSVTSRIGQKAVEMGAGGADEWLKAVAFSPPRYELRLARSDGETSLRFDQKAGGWRCTGEGKGALDLLPVTASGSFKIEVPLLPIRVDVDEWGTIEDKADNTKRLIIDCGRVYPGKQTLKLRSSFLPPSQTIEGESRKWWFQWHTGVETQETTDKTKNLYYLVKTLADKIYELRLETKQDFTLWK